MSCFWIIIAAAIVALVVHPRSRGGLARGMFVGAVYRRWRRK